MVTMMMMIMMMLMMVGDDDDDDDNDDDDGTIPFTLPTKIPSQRDPGRSRLLTVFLQRAHYNTPTVFLLLSYNMPCGDADCSQSARADRDHVAVPCHPCCSRDWEWRQVDLTVAHGVG